MHEKMHDLKSKFITPFNNFIPSPIKDIKRESGNHFDSTFY